MKILWIANIPLIGENGKKNVFGGWIGAISEILIASPEIDFVYCYPQGDSQGFITDSINGTKYYGFPSDMGKNNYKTKVEELFRELFRKENPDVIHIFGTEYVHSLEAARAGDLNKIVFSIQGLISSVAKYYCVGIPYLEQIMPCYNGRKRVFQIYADRKRYRKAGKWENEILSEGYNFEGRTDFDRANIMVRNPKARYFKCNRILRKEFYLHEWSLESCERNSIFLSQGSYPIKGLHIFLEALYMLIKMGVNAKVYVGGNDIIHEKYISSAYSSYIRKLIKQYSLHDHIFFLGNMDEKTMCRQYLKTHVFVSPSVLENLPNSLGEAMILGVPSIASDVGGVSNLVDHRVDGLIYRTDAPEILAYYMYSIMLDDNLANSLSINARQKAAKVYDREINIKDILSMYDTIANNK